MQQTELAVRKSVVVAAPIERAFEVFTGRIGEWWPLDSHAIRPRESETATFEAHEGGRIYEQNARGEQADWGRVRVWEPPRRVIFSWQITEPETEVEVRFTEEAEGTRVELEHRGWERLGPDADRRRASYDEGWDYVLGRRYTEAVGR